MFKRILVANRGEIALRVIRACRELGIETVAIYSEADRGAHYLSLADEAYCIGGPKALDSYLKIDRVISAAEIGNVQAIHPGFGFLSENAHFNEVCRDCQITFIGPTPEAMAKLGDKNSARKLAIEAKVPVVPGSDGLITDEAQAIKTAREIGFPVLIKATAGGGGRGMRVASNDLTLKSAIQQASAEALAAFGNAGIYLERYVEKPRHVEVQIIGDQHGNVVPPVGTRLFDPAPASETDRRKPLVAAASQNPRGHVRSGRAACQDRWLHQRWHRRVHR